MKCLLLFSLGSAVIPSVDQNAGDHDVKKNNSVSFFMGLLYIILAEKSLEKYFEEGGWKVDVRKRNGDVDDTGSGLCPMIDFVYY
jgi:hypothetical protein